jgi:hypothetical protein
MDARAKPDLAEQIAAALGWWRDAGIDYDYVDAPRDWRTRVAAPAPEVAAPAAVAVVPGPASPADQIGGPPERWPTDIEGFRTWWLSEPSLDHGGVARRVPPRGPAGAELMVLVGDPEQGDDDALLSGPRGKLVAGIHTALAMDVEQVYFASALPRCTPLPAWDQLAAEGLGAVVRHHIALVAPKRLIVFGGGVSSLIGHDPTKKTAGLHDFNHDNLRIPLLAAMDLAALLARPRAKAGLWQRLLDWTGTIET